ncbi:putative integral membrane protein (TIGR02206 family) [Paenibacillus phyllosphaerae]|uniref:Putative integral membrane protein (TIGR02206 family) n=1 Tax=Paenibacillus phyllosphaerae TaxID=274593 RepID=A0A7W5FR46_9BACL|nr:TIGR02206 family membrane protein [Paenibacillus phyllosphaerae]MBB3113907.1 putative integral membrane protein (TIGR02206 family) [Paenibacillus phyllosphaerae]
MGMLTLSGDYTRFTAFSLTHIVALVACALLILLLYVAKSWLQQGDRRRLFARLTLVGILGAAEAALNVWYVREDAFGLSDTLPLELCSISLYMCILMLLFRSKRLFQIVYFTGIGGAMQALLTPVLTYGFPHFRFLQFFLAHSFIILAVLYMVWVEKFRPTLRSIGLTMIFLNLLLVIILLVNKATGGNYMFVSRKPDTASVLDLLGPYPWYLLSMEGLAVVIFLLLYAPFHAGNRRERRQLQLNKQGD